MAVSCASLLEVKSVPATAVSLFFLGLGWNLSFVVRLRAAPSTSRRRPSAVASSASTTSWPRSSAASLALLYGFVLSESGLIAFALAATITVLLPIAFVVRAGGRTTPSAVASEPA